MCEICVRKACLENLSSLSDRFKVLVAFGFQRLSSSAVNPQVKPLIDSFVSTNHNITEVSVFYMKVMKLLCTVFFV